jgi:MFS family permease
MDNIITERDSLVKTSSNLSDYAAIEQENNEETEYLLKKHVNSANSNQSSFSTFINENQGVITCIILGTLSVVNITDRYVVGSVLIDIENFFDVTKSTAGLLQTFFLLSYMAFSTPFGYLGDRINRKYLIITSILIWIVATFSGSFTNEKQFHYFVLSRCLFGVATASFETISTPILGDRFSNSRKYRTRALIMTCLGPPIGFGLSYLIGLISHDWFGSDWRYTLRFTQIILILILILTLTCYVEPSRGHHGESEIKSNSFIVDMKILFYNKTYILMIFCWTFGIGSLGAFSWWSSSIIDYSLNAFNKVLSLSDIRYYKKFYSILQVTCGALGLFLPLKFSSHYHKKFMHNIDCFLLSIGFFLNSFFLYFYLFLIDVNMHLTMILYSLVIVTFNTCWVIKCNIFLDIIRPNQRSTAIALIICVLHLVGDSISPYWVGLIADECLNQVDYLDRYSISTLLNCTVISFYPLVFGSFLAATCALFMTITFYQDKYNANLSKNILNT